MSRESHPVQPLATVATAVNGTLVARPVRTTMSGVLAMCRVCARCARARRLSEDAVQCEHLKLGRLRSGAGRCHNCDAGEPKKCLVHERKERGWWQEDAAQYAERVADRFPLAPRSAKVIWAVICISLHAK